MTVPALLAAAFVLGLEVAAPQPGDAAPAPILAFERTHVDLGAISDDVARTEVFHFTNVSDRPARLSIGSCHFCGVPTSDKQVYSPGEKGVIFVLVNPVGKRGLIRAGGTVLVVGVEGYHVDVEVTAEVRPRVWAEPESVTLEGVVRGTSPPATFTLCGRAPGFAVTNAECDPPIFQASLGTPSRRGGVDDEHVCFPVTVLVSKSLPIGTHAAQVRMSTTDPRNPVRTVTCAIDVVGELRAVPEQVSLGLLPAAAPFSTDVLIESRVGGPMRLVGFDVLDRGLMCDVALDYVMTPSGLRLRVSGRAPSRPIQWSEGRVAVSSVADDGVQESLQIPIGVSVRAVEPAPP